MQSTLLAVGLTSLIGQLYAGDIVGRVLDTRTNGYMEGAEISVLGEGISAITDSQGRFRINNLAAGEYTLRVTSVGFDAAMETVSVSQTGVATTNIELGGEIVQLGEFTVEGYRDGWSKALQQKRSADLIKDVISADSVGNLPDRNVAEALSRVSGVSLDVAGGDGEGRFVSIRGIEPNFNNVTLNGATLAPPSAGGREGRAMPLDVVSSSQISQIEVIKTVTPDMDGNALGGAINIKTASGFDRPERFMYGSVEIGKNSVADDQQYQAEFTYGNTFADDTVGLAFSLNYSDRPYVSHDIQASWATLGNDWYVRTLELQPASGSKVRQGLDFNLEFRPDGDTEWWIRGIFNQFDQEQREGEFIIDREVQPPAIVNNGAGFTSMTFETRDFQREIDQTLMNITVGGKRRVGELTYEGDVTYSFSQEDVPFIKSVQFRNRRFAFPGSAPFEFSWNNFTPGFEDYGQMPTDPSTYAYRRVRRDSSLVEEKTWTPRFDVRRDFNDLFGGKSGFMKFGAKGTFRQRFVDDNSERPSNGSLTMADLVTQGPGFQFMEGRYYFPFTFDSNEAFDYIDSHSGDFTIDPIESASNSIEDDYDVTEDIWAIYGMLNLNLSDRLTMVAGLRFEHTNADLIAYEFQEGEAPDPNSPGDTISTAEVVENHGDFSYDTWLPNLQFRYDINERSLFRAAVTGTIGRPQYEKASPIAVLEYELLDPDDPESRAGELEIGNPELSPYESINIDLAYEYYLESGGIFSLGAFHKSIDNPIYTFSKDEENVTYNGLFFESLSTESQLNAESADLTGLEVMLQMPFSTFAGDTGFLSGFGVDLNATFITSETVVIGRENENLPFFRQPERIYNVGLYFQQYGFSARIAYNYQDESLRSLEGDAAEDQWDRPRQFTDIQASYKFSEGLTAYITWQNVFGDRFERTYGRESGRVRRAEYYGSYLRGGLRFRF